MYSCDIKLLIDNLENVIYLYSRPLLEKMGALHQCKRISRCSEENIAFKASSTATAACSESQHDSWTLGLMTAGSVMIVLTSFFWYTRFGHSRSHYSRNFLNSLSLAASFQPPPAWRCPVLDITLEQPQKE